MMPTFGMDRRRSSSDLLQELRTRAVEMKKQGRTHREIARALAIGESTSRLYWRLYKQGQHAALKLRRRGRQPGAKRRLSARQERAVQKAITDQTPDQLKMPFALWTRQAVGELIQRRHGISLPVRTLGEYLRRWGFTPQKPRRRDDQQQPAAVQRWLDVDHPRVQRRARAEGAVIYWGDETGINHQDQVGRSYAPRGQTPTRRAQASKVSTCMISAVTNKGQPRFMLYRQALTVKVFIGFLRRLTRATDRKVILILDNLRVHKARAVRAWLEGRENKSEWFICRRIRPNSTPTNT